MNSYLLNDKNIINGIYIHSFWRSSSTYFFYKFKEINKLYPFYEPFNEVLYSCDANYLLEYGPQSWDSGHDFASGPYLSEYYPLLKGTYGIEAFEKNFGIERFFPSDTLFPEKKYLQNLCDYAKSLNKIPCFGFVRSMPRAGIIKKNMGGFHITQYKNPHDIFDSLLRKQAIPVIFDIAKLLYHSPFFNLFTFDIDPKFIDDYSNKIYDLVLQVSMDDIVYIYAHVYIISLVISAFYSDCLINLSEDIGNINIYIYNCFYNIEFNDIKNTGNCLYNPAMFLNIIDDLIGTTDKIYNIKIGLEKLLDFEANSVATIEILHDQLKIMCNCDHSDKIEHGLHRIESIKQNAIKRCLDENLWFKAHCKHLDEKYNAIINSRTWRYTRILRWISSHLK